MVAAEEGGGVAGVDPFRAVAVLSDLFDRGFEMNELAFGILGVEDLGRAEVSGDSFEFEGGEWVKSLEEFGEEFGAEALAGHAGVEF